MPRHTRQNHPEVRRPTECDPTTGEKRPHKHPKRASAKTSVYLSLPPTRQELTQSPKPEGRLSDDKGEGRSGTSRDSNPAGLCCSSAHLVQCEPDEPSSFTNPNVGPGTYAEFWLELDSKVKCHTAVP